jgi:hypothetical protein
MRCTTVGYMLVRCTPSKIHANEMYDMIYTPMRHVYEMHVYICARPGFDTSPPGTCPAESPSHLGVAESLQTGKSWPQLGLYRTERMERRI